MSLLNIFRAIPVNREQKKLDKALRVDGLTDENLEKQLEINAKRNKYNIINKKQLQEDKYLQ